VAERHTDGWRRDRSRRLYAFLATLYPKTRDAVTSPKHRLPPETFPIVTPVAPLPASTLPKVTFA
jgi:hypothetical protein